MIKIIGANDITAAFSHRDFRLDLRRKTVTAGWAANLIVHAGPKDVQQLRLDLAERLEQVADILRSQEAAIIKTVTEAL